MKKESSPTYQVSAFYKFVSVKNCSDLKVLLDGYLKKTNILGTVLLAREGVNGTISGPSSEVKLFLEFLRIELGVDSLPFKIAQSEQRPFHRMKVKLKKEIVTLGVDGIDPNQRVGTYVSPKDWNDLISREDVVLLDTRNDYELSVGTFKGAENPKTNSFREFPEYVENSMDPRKTPKVAMFCTGGIRCEKASAFMLEKGYKEVFHLEGGVLEYFNQIPEEESLWEGECFVFDERVTVNQSLERGSYEMCHACRMPLSEEDRGSEFFEKGISCPHCFGQISDEKRSRLEQRNKQMELAKSRNQTHLGKTQSRHKQISADELA